jgi:hypothetical protein
VTRFVFLRNTHQEESHVASQTAGELRYAYCLHQKVSRQRFDPKRVLPAGKTGLPRRTTSNGAYPTFLAWLRKHRAASSQAPNFSPAAPSFVPLQLEPSAYLHRSRGRQVRCAASCTLEFPNGVLVHFSGDIDAQLLTCLLHAAGDKS